MSNYKLERIANIDEEIEQLRKRQKELKQEHIKQERKDRTKRLCSRHGLLEKMLPEIITVTDEQYQDFLEKAVTNNYGRDILSKIIAQTAATPKVKAAASKQKNDNAADGESAVTEKPNATEQTG